MKYWRISCAALMMGLAAQCTYGAGMGDKPGDGSIEATPASPTLSDSCAAVIKTAYPNATIGKALLNADRGMQVYYVDVTGDKNVNTVEVTVLGTLLQDSLKIDQKDLPDAVAKAATTAAGDGATFSSATKLDLLAEFTPKTYSSNNREKIVPLTPPTVAYDVTFSKESVKGVVRVGADGTVIDPINWMKRASADVPPGKLVIRAHLGCYIPYTDLSGIVWAADQKYTKESTWGFTDGRPHSRLGLTILGTDAPYIYDSERDKEGAYRFDVPNGTYTVRVHFCETWEGAKKPNLREFGIKINGNEVVNKMDIAGAAGGWLIPLVKEFKDIPVTDGKLIVAPFSNNNRDQHPSVQAYEIYAQ